MKHRLGWMSVLVLMIATMPGLPVLAQPSNDNLAGAVVVDDIPFDDTVGLDEATTEPGEPVAVCAPMANTVWYALTLPQSSTVMIDTTGSGFDTVLAVWQGGDIASLDLVKCVDDTSIGVESRILLSADAGATYLIQAGAFGGAPDGAVLSLSIDSAPRMTGKPVVYRGSSRGNVAQAYFDEFDGTTSTSTSVSLFDGQAKYAKGKPYKSSEVSVYRSSSSYDDSTGVYTWESWFGFAPLEPGSSQLDARLRSASVDMAVTLFGYSCQEGPYEETDEGVSYTVDCSDLGSMDVMVDVSWTGQGSTYRYSYTDRSSTNDGYRALYASSTTARDASVAGDVVGEGWSTDMDGAFGTLQRDSNRTMTMYRGIYAY